MGARGVMPGNILGCDGAGAEQLAGPGGGQRLLRRPLRRRRWERRASAGKPAGAAAADRFPRCRCARHSSLRRRRVGATRRRFANKRTGRPAPAAALADPRNAGKPCSYSVRFQVL